MAYHIFIAPDVSAGRQAILEKDYWHGKLLLRSWGQILTICNSLLKFNDHNSQLLHKWIKQTILLFNKLDIKPFNGFACIDQPYMPDSVSHVFWKGPLVD